MGTSVSLNITMILLIILSISVVGMLFVHFDAKKRRMNTAVWTAIAFFGPFFIGVLIYLINRVPVSELQCSNCGAAVSADDTECTSCGSRLITQCSNCHCPVEKGWTECHICGTKLPENFGQPVRIYKQERGRGVLIGIVVVLIVAIFAGGIMLFNKSESDNAGENVVVNLQGMYNIEAAELKNNNTLKRWIEDCDSVDERVCAIVSKSSRTCIVYVKNSTMLMNSNMDYYYDEVNDWCRVNIQINETEYYDTFGYRFFMYKFDVYDDTQIEVELFGNIVDVNVTFTDMDISYNSWGDGIDVEE